MKTIPPSRRRKLRTWSAGSGPAELQAIVQQSPSNTLLDLASNDYLGLISHSSLIEAAKLSLESDGVGSGGSRLVTGNRPIHEQLENELGEWLGRESVLLFPSGFQANIAAVMTLANRHSTVLVDRLIHNSLLVGVKASGAKLIRFAHNDLQSLENELIKSKKTDFYKQLLVITESLFSMEGSSPNIRQMTKICEKHGARMLVDEAHALGVIGPQGKGLCHGASSKTISMISGTFGKAFGSGGAFLATNALLGDQILQTSGAFKYTTALAPSIAAAALAALNLLKENPHWGEELQNRAQKWRDSLVAEGWERPPGYGPILSMVMGTDELAIKKQAQLERAGILSVAIRPPTVPEGTSRLRIVLRKNIPQNTLKILLKALKTQ